MLEVERCERMVGKVQKEQDEIDEIVQGSSVMDEEDLPLSVIRLLTLNAVVQEMPEGRWECMLF